MEIDLDDPVLDTSDPHTRLLLLAEHWKRECGKARSEVAAKDAEIDRLRTAIRWALGEIDDFPLREPGQGAYWWRTELRRRAALKDHGDAP